MRDGLGTPQTLLVLGGGSDIGTAIAERLARDGARDILLAARRPERLATAAERVRRSGARVDVIPFDAEAIPSHAETIDDAFDRLGDVDVAVLAFGVLPDQGAAMKDPEVALQAARVNYLGAVSVLVRLADRMRQQGHGDIVVLSSVAAERGRRSNFVYGSTKAGLDTFCQGLGDDLHGSGVRLLVIRPGFVRSKMTVGLRPTPLSTTPSDVAVAAIEGLRRGAEVVWVPPTLRFVMSGLRHLPRPVFRRLEI